MNDRERVAATGRALYGDDWIGPLASVLGVSRRSVERWIAATAPVPPGVLTECDRLRAAHGAASEAVTRMLGEGYLVTLERQEG